jgi:hypothetical protein
LKAISGFHAAISMFADDAMPLSRSKFTAFDSASNFCVLAGNLSAGGYDAFITFLTRTAAKSPDVSDNIRKSLDQAGFKERPPKATMVQFSP